MRSDQSRDDELVSPEQLARIIRELDMASEEYALSLLDALFCAAWPTPRAQDQ